MTELVIVWDLETVPDLSAVARLHDLPSTEPALIRDALGDKVPKHLFHSIVHWKADCSASAIPGS